jgi:protein-L-isoaspartate(D-aspartate) O-methyltransferase
MISLVGKRAMMKIFLSVLFLLLYSPLLVAAEDAFSSQREEMVREQIEARGVKEPRVLGAMRKVRRHLFVPAREQEKAYKDHPLPIGHGQTISQPYIVAYMTEAARLNPADRVLEIGTGSGYQAAVLAELVKEVYTIEILKPLADNSRSLLEQLGYKNIRVKWGDGYKGWKEYAPFDAVIVTAAPEAVPKELINQLKSGGRMIIPIGGFFQELYRITKIESGIRKETLLPVRFVPMVHPKGEKQ